MAIARLYNSNTHDKHNTIREALGMFDMSEFNKCMFVVWFYFSDTIIRFKQI